MNPNGLPSDSELPRYIRDVAKVPVAGNQLINLRRPELTRCLGGSTVR